ncbi:MAG TPA: FAD-binding oxidoreductase [Solirubrobacteraceae bacterium]
MSSERVVVVGGGIAGTSAALHLAEAGADVVLFDDARAGRATYAGAGIVGWPWRNRERPIFELQRRSVAAYPELAARIGASFDVVGEMFVARHGRLLDEAEAALALGTAGPVRRLEPEQARELFPYLAPELAGLHVATTARVQGDAIRDRLRDAAVAAGAEVVPDRAELDAGPAGVRAVKAGGRRIEASAVVVAAGTWSAELVASSGVRLEVAPQRGQILHLGVREETAELVVVQPLGADHYLLPFADRRVVVGATRETGSGFDPRLTAAGVAEILGDALAVAPGLAGATLRELRVGLRPSTPDGDPILGPVPGCPGLWVATGMGPQGLTIGPYCGRLVADAVLGRPPELDLTPYSAGRFG